MSFEKIDHEVRRSANCSFQYVVSNWIGLDYAALLIGRAHGI